MSEIVSVLAPQPRRALEALAMFRFLTVKQLVQLGISEARSEDVIRKHALGPLKRHRRPLAKRKKLSRWQPEVHYMTRFGAEALAELYRLPLEHFRFPKGEVQFSEHLAFHRFAQIDFHIGIRLWAQSRTDAELLFADMDFDTEGARRHGTFIEKTRITLPGGGFAIADGIFGVEFNGDPALYALEVHRTTETKAVSRQIKIYMDVLEHAAIAEKYGCLNTPTLICSVHTKDNVLRGVKAHLMRTPDFPAFLDHFAFNTTDQLALDFSEGWHLANGEPINPFPKPDTPISVPLFA
jgi:hypothetical protein